MDMFMDKLAQKLTAQEIIKANTAADIEELNKLKNQIAEYNECLARLQKLIDDAAGRLAGTQERSDEIDRLMTENINGIQALKQEISQVQAKLAWKVETAGRSLEERLDALDKALGGRMDVVGGTLTDRMDRLEVFLVQQANESGRSTAGRAEALDQALGNMNQALGNVNQSLGNLDQSLGDRVDSLEESVESFGDQMESMEEALGKRLDSLGTSLAEQAGEELSECGIL